MADATTIPDWLRPTVYRADFNKYMLIEELMPGMFAVRHCGWVWNFRTGNFVYEPEPSSRSDPFERNTRRPLAKCIEALAKMRGEYR